MKDKIYVILSLFSTFLLVIGIIQLFPEIYFFGLRFSVIWIPIWCLTLWLPFYGIIEILKRTDEINYSLWFAFLLNLFNFFLVAKHLGIQLFS
ncbi:hypothetical protein [Flavobacterium sp. U410]|jgi:hypothetical protein